MNSWYERNRLLEEATSEIEHDGVLFDIYLSEYSNAYIVRSYSTYEKTTVRMRVSYQLVLKDRKKAVDIMRKFFKRCADYYNSPLMKALR